MCDVSDIQVPQTLYVYHYTGIYIIVFISLFLFLYGLHYNIIKKVLSLILMNKRLFGIHLYNESITYRNKYMLAVFPILRELHLKNTHPGGCYHGKCINAYFHF